MIDVMMFLLVFFVLISLNVIPALGLKTQLPSAGSAQQLKPQKKRSSRWGRRAAAAGWRADRARRVG